MQEEGKVQKLKTKWWKEKIDPSKCISYVSIKVHRILVNTNQFTFFIIILPGEKVGICDESTHGDSDTPELGMDNVGGVFLVLAAGLVVAIFIGILEFLWNVRKVSIDAKVSATIFNMKRDNFHLHIYYLTDNSVRGI